LLYYAVLGLQASRGTNPGTLNWGTPANDPQYIVKYRDAQQFVLNQIMDMNRYLFMNQLLPLMGKPGFLNKLVGLMLRVAAAVVILISIAFIFHAGKKTFELTTQTIMGGILFDILYIIAIYSVVHAILIRGREIEQMPQHEYMVLSMGSILLKLVGEVYAFFTNTGVSTILNPMPWFYPAPSNPNFTGGLTIILVGVLLATAVLIGFYMLAELVSLLVRPQNRPVSTPRQIANYSKSRYGG
jgi:hypothetical protein